MDIIFFAAPMIEESAYDGLTHPVNYNGSPQPSLIACLRHSSVNVNRVCLLRYSDLSLLFIYNRLAAANILNSERPNGDRLDNEQFSSRC